MSVFGPSVGAAADTINLRGPYASLPTAGVDGRIYFATDSVFPQIRDNAAAWQHFRDGQVFNLAEDSGFAWVNQGTATVTTVGGVTTLRALGLANYNFRLRVKAAPATPWTLLVAILHKHGNNGVIAAGVTGEFSGLVLRESSTGKLITLGMGGIDSGNLGIVSQRLNSPTSFNGNQATTYWQFTPGVSWLRIIDDGTDLTWEVSYDGVEFVEIKKEPRLTFLTVGPNQIGYCVNSNENASLDAFMSILSWTES